jgi:hypothetical protein
MNHPPGGKPATKTVAAVTAHPSGLEPEVYLRDTDGRHPRRISISTAKSLVELGIAEQVSAAGHVRLRLGIRPSGETGDICGIPAIELSRRYRGDRQTARDLLHQDRQDGRWQPPAV